MVHLGGLVSIAFDEIGMHRDHLLVLEAKPLNQFGCESSQRRERQTYGMKERRRGETEKGRYKGRENRETCPVEAVSGVLSMSAMKQ